MPRRVWSVLEGCLVGGKVIGERHAISRHFRQSRDPENWNKKLQKEGNECNLAKYDKIKGTTHIS